MAGFAATFAPLTREDVREELKHFLWDSFASEITDLGTRVQQDLQIEFRRFLEELNKNEKQLLRGTDVDDMWAIPPSRISTELENQPKFNYEEFKVSTPPKVKGGDLNMNEAGVTVRSGRLSDRFEARITRYASLSRKRTSAPNGGRSGSKGNNSGNMLHVPVMNAASGKSQKCDSQAKVYPLCMEEVGDGTNAVATMQVPETIRHQDSESSDENQYPKTHAWSEDTGRESMQSAYSSAFGDYDNSDEGEEGGQSQVTAVAKKKAVKIQKSDTGLSKSSSSSWWSGRKRDKKSSVHVGRVQSSHENRSRQAALMKRGGRQSTTSILSFGNSHRPCWQFFCNIVKSENFDYFMGFFLVLNAIILGIQVDFMAQEIERNPEAPFHFRVMDVCFCVIFSLELLARLLVYGGNLYRMKGWGWSVFDTIIVVFQIIDELVVIFLTGTEVQEFIDSLGVLNMLRLGRIVRLLRMVRLIPELKSMVYLISASMWSFFWTVVLLCLMMYCVAVYYTQLAANLARDNPNLTTDIKALWGSVMTSVLSLYQAITGGDDWRNFIEVFRGSDAGMYIQVTLVFTIYIAFATLVMLNLVTGVFVEGAQRIIKEDRDSELIRHVCRLFVIADQDQSQGITWSEFQEHLEDKGMNEYFKAVDLSRQEAKDLFKLLDVDNSGTISVEEFVRGCIRLRGPARSVDLAALVYDFKLKMGRSEEHMVYIEESMARLGKLLSMIWRSVADIEPLGAMTYGIEEAVEGILV